MLCPKCNNPLEDGALFCGNCGSPVMPTESAVAPAAEPAPDTAEVPPTESYAVPPTESYAVPPTESYAVPPTETVPEVTVKARKPVGWIVTAVLSAVVLLGVGAFFLCRTLFGGGALSGTWQVSLRMNELMDLVTDESIEQAETMLGAQYGDISKLDIEAMLGIFDIEEPLTAYLTFDKDTVDVTVNVDEFGDAMAHLVDNMIVYIEDGGLYDIYAMQGYSREETDEMLAQSGMDMESMIAMLRLSQSQMKVGLASSLETAAIAVDGKNYTLLSANYTFKDGRLSIPEIPEFSVEIEVQGDRIRITDSVVTAMEGFDQLEACIRIERAELPK